MLGSVGTLNMLRPTFSKTRNNSVSIREGGDTGRALVLGGITSIDASPITRRNSATNFVMSSSGSTRTSSIASPSDGITFERKPILIMVGTTDVRRIE